MPLVWAVVILLSTGIKHRKLAPPSYIIDAVSVQRNYSFMHSSERDVCLCISWVVRSVEVDGSMDVVPRPASGAGDL